VGEIGSVYGWSLLQNIRRLLELDWKIKIRHSYRETNKCTDVLVNMAVCDGGYSLMIHEYCLLKLICYF